MEKIFNVKGMHCKSCEVLLSDVISEVSGVSKVQVNHKDGKIIIQYTEPSIPETVKRAIEKEGYNVIA